MIRKFFFWFFIVLFIGFAAVQYNDEDGWLWILVYLLSAFMCYQAMNRQGDRFSFIAVATIFTLWSINQFPPEWEGIMLNTAGMKTLNIELGRESLGLLFCSAAMIMSGLWD